MSSNTSRPPVAWSTVAAKGLKVKVPEPMRRMDSQGIQEKLVPHTLYEDENIKSHLLAQKVYSVLQNTLSPGSVLFSFPGKLFDHRSEAYKLVVEQIGPVVGNGFRPVSMFGNRLKDELLFSAVFRLKEHSKKAIEQGVKHNGIVYLGSPYKDGVKSRLVRVFMDLHVTEEEEIMIEKLRTSMGHYGNVCDMKKYTARGFFEGQVSVLLDVSQDVDTEKRCQPLTKMLFLEAWDVFVAAYFRGAPSVCYHCRKNGHIKKECPRLKTIECFRCHEMGHTSRFCKKREQVQMLYTAEPSVTKSDLKHVTPSFVQKEKAMVHVESVNDIGSTEKITVIEDNEKMVETVEKDEAMSVHSIDSDEEMEVRPSSNKTTTITSASDVVGTLGSRYAPVDQSITMDVDSPM